jgi:hypothetical protein
MWPFKPKKSTVVENIGPDAPKIRLAAEIISYAMVDGKLKMSFQIGEHVYTTEVPSPVPRHYPLGTSIRLVVEYV